MGVLHTLLLSAVLLTVSSAASGHKVGAVVPKTLNALVSQFSCKYHPNILPDAQFYSLLNVAQWQTLVALRGAETDGNTTAAAVAYAGHYVLANYFRFEQEIVLDSVLNQLLNSLNLSSGQRRLARITAYAVAGQLLRNRHNSGSAFNKDALKLPAVSEVNLGEFSFATPPQSFYAPQGPNGLPWNYQALHARTYILPAPESFRKASLRQLKPPEVPSDAFDKEYDIAFRLGRSTSTDRTPDQTVVALFWGLATKGSVCSFMSAWMDAAIAAIPDDYPLSKTVALFAQASVAGHDVTSLVMHMQWSFRNARPAQSIQQGDPRHAPVPDWNSLFPAGPHPDYPSGMASVAGAVTGVLQALLPAVNPVNILGKVPLSFFGLPAIPGTRTFQSWNAAGEEAAVSRVFIGAHFNRSAMDGLAVGRKVAQYVLQNWGERTPSGVLPDEEFLTFVSNQVDKVGEPVPVKILLPDY